MTGKHQAEAKHEKWQADVVQPEMNPREQRQRCGRIKLINQTRKRERSPAEQREMRMDWSQRKIFGRPHIAAKQRADE